jgi:uncharacterized protein (TIGR03437 family)
MIRLIIAFLCAAAACMLVAGALSSAQTTATATPDAFVAQISGSNRASATNPAGSFASDMSANGRFVVLESNADIATEKTDARNNRDGNREIFLYDYAQRRVFQITNTRSVLKPAGSASPSPSPSPSPSVSPSPTPTASPTPPVDEPGNVAIEISNNEPMISLEPTLVGTQRTYTIVFSSNAPVSPANFDGTDPGAPTNTDMNWEIWTYRFTVPDDTLDLSSGANVATIDLSAGTFTRITNTPASRAPSPGSATVSPFIADDNRDASISDDGQIIAFISTRNFAGTTGFSGAGNPDFNPEVYLFNRNTSALIQVTNTSTTSQNNPIFSSNTCLSSNGSVFAFISNANLAANNDDGSLPSNGEIYLANFNGTTVSGLRQVTKTKIDTIGATVNLFTLGRRLSRDGSFLAFESLASDPKANSTTNTSFYCPFVYTVATDTFTQLGPRATVAGSDPVFHVPVFTDYNAALSPASVMFTSALNFLPDGSIPASGSESTGLNPGLNAQIFLAPLPVASSGPFTRISNFPVTAAGGVGAAPSNSRRRLAFSRSAELGLGNSDGSVEAFYQLSPNITSESSGTLTMFTGASLGTVPVSSPTASPTVSPSPSPSPSPTASPSGSPAPFAPTGLAAGELAIAQSSVSLAPVSVTVANSDASESKRAPFLPIELNGVSVSIRGAACGLYAVSPTQIKFVVPIGLAPGTLPIVINNNGTVVRGVITIVSAQPDIFTSANGPGGRASVCNATNPAVCSPEPFTVTTNDGTGSQVATVLRVSLTGIRFTLPASVNVTIGTTVIVASVTRSTDLPGTDQIDVTLPSTVDTGDLPIVVAVGGVSSRTGDTAPHITINPGGSAAPNPINNTDFFVRQQYLDFLNREPDPSGYAFWQNEINSCGADLQCVDIKRINVSAAFFLSIEFKETGYLVYRTHKAAYGNVPNTPVPVRLNEFKPEMQQIGNGVIVNQTGWQDLLEANKVAYFNSFVQTQRFIDAYQPTLTAQQFVDKLYQTAGIAPASAPNHQAALNELSSAPADNAARARALRLVAEDSMLAQQEFNRAFVLMQYFGYLQRNPDDAPDGNFNGYNFWLDKLNQFNGDFINAEMVKAFLVSAEYRQRFGP